MGLGGGGLEGLTSGDIGGGPTAGAPVAGLGTWRFRTETNSPPATGQLRFSADPPEAAGQIFLHETNDDGADMANFLDQLGVGSFLYIQDRSNSDNFIVVQITSNTDSGVYRTFGIDQIEVQGAKPNQNTEVAIVAVGDPSPAAATAFAEFHYDPDNLIPGAAGWLETTPPGGPVADTNNAALRVLLFDGSNLPTTREGVGWQHVIPDGATSFTITFIGRAETAPAGARQIGTRLAVRQVPDNGAVAANFSQINSGDFDIPANEFFQYDQLGFTLAFFGLTAGRLTQWQFMRDSAAGANLTGDYALAEIRHQYS